MEELIKINEIFKDFKISEFISPEEDMRKIIESEKVLAREEGLKEGREEGLEQGIEQGIVQGLEQGIERGIEQGIEQGMGKGIETVARNLLQMAIPIEQISKATLLSIEQLKKLV